MDRGFVNAVINYLHQAGSITVGSLAKKVVKVAKYVTRAIENGKSLNH